MAHHAACTRLAVTAESTSVASARSPEQDAIKRRRSIVRVRSGRCITALAALTGMIARAAMTPAPPMQGKTIRGAVVAILAVRAALAVGTVRGVAALGLLGLLLRLAAGDEGR